MGLSSSPYIFAIFSNFLVRAFTRGGIANIINYLDDFAVAAHTWDELASKQRLVIKKLRYMGFFINLPFLIIVVVSYIYNIYIHYPCTLCLCIQIILQY